MKGGFQVLLGKLQIGQVFMGDGDDMDVISLILGALENTR